MAGFRFCFGLGLGFGQGLPDVREVGGGVATGQVDEHEPAGPGAGARRDRVQGRRLGPPGGQRLEQR